MKQLNVDILERSRSEDRDAFRALFAFWSEPAFATALLFTQDAGSARDAVRDAFVSCWQDLPSMHSETPFRPVLLGLVARAASTKTAADIDHPLGRCLTELDHARRAAAILGGHAAMPAADVALALGIDIATATRRIRSGLKDLSRCLGHDGKRALATATIHASVGARFFDVAVAPQIDDRWLLEVRRVVRRPRTEAWRVLTDPTAIGAWTSAEGARVRGGGPLVPGARIAAGGHIADRRASQDESVVTRAERPSLLAWTTRSHVSPYPGTVEFRWTIAIEEAPDGCELRHRLLGIAFPHGPIGRVLRKAVARVEDSMHTSMHRGSERLAALIEART